VTGKDLETARYGGKDVRDGDLRKAVIIPGGCMMITRAAAKKLVDTYPNLLYYKANNREKTSSIAPYLGTIAVFPDGNRTYVIEDVAFSARCIEAGLELWVDTKLKFKHWGWHGYELPEEAPPST